MKYLVTGGAGFIGSHYLHYMTSLYKEDTFVCLDSLTYASNYKNIKKLEKFGNYKFIQGDISSEEFINKLFKEEQFDVVVNFAAESHVDKSINNPIKFIESNIKNTSILLEASKNNNIKRFHQVSTIEVYGEENVLDEKSGLNPSNPYATTKACADLLVMTYYKTYNLPVTISRCTNNYGPNQYPEKLIPLVITSALNNKQIPVYGKGEYKRDWIYVLDHIRAIDLIIQKGNVGEIYNVSAHVSKSNIELVKLILSTLNKPDSLINFVSARPMDYKNIKINSNKLEKLGWKPKFSFEEGIKNTIEWYIENYK